MAKKLRVDVQVNTVINASTEQLQKVQDQIGKIDKNMPGVSQDQLTEFGSINEEINKIKNNMKADLDAGTILDPNALQAYNSQIQEQETRMRNLTNTTIKQLSTNKNFKKDLDDITLSIEKQEDVLKQKQQALDDVKKRTEAVTEAEKAAAKKLGISVGQINTDAGIDAEIKKRQTASGVPLKGEAKNIEELMRVKKVREETLKLEGDIVDQREQASAELEKEQGILEAQKNEREQMLLREVDNIAKQKNKDGSKKYSEDQIKQLKENIKLGKSFDQIRKSIKGVTFKKITSEMQKNMQTTKAATDANQKKKKSFLENVTAATFYYAAIRTLRRLMRETTRTITELDKSFTQIAMVTNMTRKESWGLLGTYQSLSKEIGITTDEVARLGVYFARQGRSASEAMELTKTAALAAKVASIDAEKSANFLTSAINGFGLAIDQSMAMSDKFAALAASSASSYEELAIALSKVAPVAKTAGVGVDVMMGFLAKGVETTREAPENIGTAFKTIFARMTQLRDFGATLEEGVGVNTVEEALATAGIALRDSQGNFRDMDQVLIELGYKFQDLSRNQQSYIATALAGTRQQSRLLAVMQDFDRTMELVDVSTESAGATLAQHAEYSKGMEAANARLRTSFQEVITSLINSELVIGIVNLLARTITNLSKISSGLITTMAILITVLLAYNAVVRRKILLETISKKGTLALNLAQQVYTVLIKKGTIATMSFGKALGIATGGVTIILGALAMLATGLFDTNKASEKTSESIRDLQVSLYNISKETKDFNSLVNRFDELDKKVFKTTEDMKEMETILDKIRDHGGSEFDFVLAGRLDRTVIKEYLEQQEQARKEAEGEMRVLGAKVVLDVFEFSESGRASDQILSQRFEDLSKEEKEAMKQLIMSTYKDYEKMTAEQRQKLSKIVQDNLYTLSRLFYNREKENLNRNWYDLMAFGIDDDTEERARDMLFTQAVELSDDLLKFFDDFDRLVENKLTEQEKDQGKASEIFSSYFKLSYYDRQKARLIYEKELGSLLSLGENTINNFLSRGYNFNVIQSIISNLEDGLQGVVNSSNMEIGANITNFYAAALSNIDPNDLAKMKGVIDETIAYITTNATNAEVALKKFIGAITDPMAFQNAMNIFKSTASTVTSLIDASEAYKKGQIDDKLLSLISEYPDLAADIRDGTLDMSKSIEIMVAKNIEDINRKISDLEYQLSVETSDKIAKIIQAQIDTLKDMTEKESFLYGGIAEQFKVRETEKASERFKEQIDFIKKYNDEQQKEIDLMEKKIGLNKSMLSLDRQISAISRDTSYGAQARARDLREQKRSAAVEREKLVMDLVTEQAISELERQRDQHIAGIAANVQAILDGMKNGNTGSDPFGTSTGLNTK
jgi:TP901 family phage tail tape measure protein